MSSYRVPLVLWLAAVSGLLVMLTSEGRIEYLGLALLVLPLLALGRAACDVLLRG